MRYRSLARRAFTDEPTVRQAMQLAAELGLLQILDDPSDPQRFTATLLKWARWEPKDSGAAERQRRSRSQKESRESAEAGGEFDPEW